MDEETKLFYNLTAEETAKEWYENYILMPSIEEFVTLLPENPRVLDLGCGAGYESMRLIKAGAQVVGVDFSEESIRIAKERCPEARFELMDFRQLDGKKLGKFDGVFACASLIHVSQKELPGVFKQLRGVLKRNGFVVAIVRKGEGFWEGWPEVNGQKIKRVVYLYSRQTLSAAASGFKHVKQGYLDPALVENGEYGWISHIFQRVE
jgi:SAM-dependent methyltransferase